LSELERERERIKRMAMESKSSVVRISAINILSFHGSGGIEDITDIIELPDSDVFVKQHGLNVIALFRAFNRRKSVDPNNPNNLNIYLGQFIIQ
jgi:hypothetical protein